MMQPEHNQPFQPFNVSSFAQILALGGEMGERIRTFDWSTTSLGPIETWPHSLRTIVSIMLTSRQPIWIGWGSELIKLYNDPYKAIVGGKHPEALGQPASLVWQDIWHDVAPMLRQVMEENVGTYVESQLLIMERYGYAEETYYTFSYNPVLAEYGGVGGMICTNTDDTQRVINERQLALLRELAAETVDAKTVEEVCTLSARALEQNPHDLPFALLYLVENDEQNVRLAGITNIPNGHMAVSANLWPVHEVLQSGKPQLLTDLDVHFGILPSGAWSQPPKQALVMPINQVGEKSKSAILVVGLNPFRKLDDGYQGFLHLVATQLASSLANAQAYEEERRRAQMLAEIDRAKTLFFSNVSHEFRTPLTLMLGPIEDTLNDPNTLPINRERMDVAYRNALRLLKLVNALLDFSRIEAGRVQAAYEPIDLAAYTTDLASGFRSAIEKAGMTLKVEIDPLSEPVYVDPEMWEKIVLNLLSNAFKYTLEGQIVVSLKQVNHTVEFKVQDTGVGIREAELSRIFERFHQVRGTVGRSLEGTGIGLSLVQELVKLHGGTIRVESIYGQGSEFIVSIPLGTTHLPSERLTASQNLPSTAVGKQAYVEEALRWLPTSETGVDSTADDTVKTRVLAADEPHPYILLADDNTDMRVYVQRLLAQNYQVKAVSDGEAALAAVHEHQPDLVLTDVMMPKLDGFGLLQALRENPLTRTIPVIMLSARAGEEARIEGVEAGADDYLVKPFSARELLARVASQLEMAAIRKQAQQAAEKERERLYTFFMQAPNPVIVLRGPNHVVELANPHALNVWRKKYEQTINRPLIDALPELQGQGIVELLNNVYTTGQTHKAHELLVQLDYGTGKLQDVYFTFVYEPMRNVNGEIEGIMVIAFVVTDEVMARKRVEESEEKYRSLFETMDQGFSIVEMIFDENNQPVDYLFIELNPMFESQTGLKNAKGRTARELVPNLEPHWFELYGKVALTGESIRFTQGSDEMGRWFDVYGFRLGGPDSRKVAILFTDITERKRIEEQRIDLLHQEQMARRAAERADQMKLQFFGMISHELRTPLASIKGFTSTLLADDVTIPPAQQREFLEIVDDETNKLTGLVEQLLDLSRMQAGMLRIEAASQAFEQVLKVAVIQMQTLANHHDLQLEVPETLPQVLVDRERIAQVLVNLVGNAVKFSPANNQILVRASHANDHVQIDVIDQGIGIPEHEHEIVFEAFRQVERKTPGHRAGVGLGLAICKAIIEAHHGKIWIEPNVPTGTQVSFTLAVSQQGKH